MTCVFVTGTDTDAGKTLVSSALLERLGEGGFRTLALKPVAAGAVKTELGMRNNDALQLELAMSCRGVSYEQVNPVCLAAPVAPHLAAVDEGISLTVTGLHKAYQQLSEHDHDFMLVEGAGGWLVPLNDQETLADLASELQAHVVLVVNMKLGCLNHALLTAADIERRGLNLVGWVANQAQAETMALAEENQVWLEHYFSAHHKAPLLASIPFQQQADAKRVADYFAESHALMSVLQGNADF